MLLKQDLLNRIWAGEVTVVFRRFKRPTVKTGGTLRTRLGVLAIEEVTPAAKSKLIKADAIAAGFDSLKALKADIDGQRPEALYRVTVRPGGEDPRIALRKQSRLPPAEVQALVDCLQGWDDNSAYGPWAWPALEWIAAHPGRRAGDLADEMGLVKKWLKGNIRRLKALGLTESLPVGYRLSPRGAAVLKARQRS